PPWFTGVIRALSEAGYGPEPIVSWSAPPLGAAIPKGTHESPSLSVYPETALAPTVELEANVRPVFWSVKRIGSRPVMVERFVLSSHSASQHSGWAGERRS